MGSWLGFDCAQPTGMGVTRSLNAVEGSLPKFLAYATILGLI